MRHASFRACLGILIILAAGLVLGCHSTSPITEGYPHQQALRGKSTEQVLACAGRPLEAPFLEESMVSSKTSRPTVHHGCWATVALHGNQVDHVRYRFVPSSVEASNDCEEVFASCSP
jgi:hypothetical protein